jgi:hypothetical protein
VVDDEQVFLVNEGTDGGTGVEVMFEVQGFLASFDTIPEDRTYKWVDLS